MRGGGAAAAAAAAAAGAGERGRVPLSGGGGARFLNRISGIKK